MNPDYSSSTAVGYATVESLLDEAAFNLRRYSRGSNGQRTNGSMRVVKPNSTSNSPRGSTGLGRRKTVMTDRRRMVIVDQVTGAFVSSELQAPASSKSNRPVSWHPSSQLGSQPIYHSAYAVPQVNNEFRIFDLPPTPAVYSGFASPSSAFSPVSIPYTGYNQQRYPNSEADISYPSNFNYAPHNTSIDGQQQIPNYMSTQADDADSSLYSHFDWTSFSNHGFERPTAPPTPEDFLPIQHPDPAFPADDAIPFHSLSDTVPDEEEGEILCGLGLYDSPEAGKAASLDPQLDNYRSSMMSGFLGSGYRIESTGKGLKLEETWNPPASDDEEDEDGDGEEEDEEDATIKEAEATVVATMQNVGHSHDGLPSTQVAQNYERISWL